jgi:hypothetical protein
VVAALITQILAAQAEIAQKMTGSPLDQATYVTLQGQHAGLQAALDILKGLQDAQDQ